MTSNAFDLSAVTEADMTATVSCAICGHSEHSLYSHVQKAHGMSADEYIRTHPGSPLLSALGRKVYDEQAAKADITRPITVIEVDSMDAFKVGFGKEGKNAKKLRGYSGFSLIDGLPPADDNYLFPVNTTRDILLGMMSGGKIYAVGPTGSGKTTIFEQIASRLGRPFFRQQFHGEMEPSELLGTWTVGKGGEMVYLYSGLAQALSKPAVICFDEFDSGNPAVTAIANALLEGKPLVLSNKGGEVVPVHPDAILVATGNTNGMGDDTGLYTSTTVQSFATMNRFQMFVVIDYMKAPEETSLLMSIYGAKGMPVKEIEDMVKVANLIRDGFIAGKITAVMSTRQLLTWAKWLGMTGDPSRAFALSFSNQLGIVDRQVTLELFQRVFGTR